MLARCLVATGAHEGPSQVARVASLVSSLVQFDTLLLDLRDLAFQDLNFVFKVLDVILTH